MKITISGKPGSGKTGVAKTIAKELGLQFRSVGDFQGDVAKKRRMTIGELMELGRTDKSVHLDVDKEIVEFGEREDNFFIDGWISYHFVPDSFKIFLDVDESDGAWRVFLHPRPDEYSCKTVEDQKENLRKRLNDTWEGFHNCYNIDFLDKII